MYDIFRTSDGKTVATLPTLALARLTVRVLNHKQALKFDFVEKGQGWV